MASHQQPSEQTHCKDTRFFFRSWSFVLPAVANAPFPRPTRDSGSAIVQHASLHKLRAKWGAEQSIGTLRLARGFVFFFFSFCGFLAGNQKARLIKPKLKGEMLQIVV